MLSNVNLRKTGTDWEFESEAVLEDFVWANLPQLFELTPLKRQYTVKGQVCDILALAENKQLVVLELKNVEDRYVVQQLTRYYDALREEKPFIEQVDYEQPIRLIAVTPSFHRDNFIDRKYSHLSIQFFLFEILQDSENLYLQMKALDTDKGSQVKIPHLERDNNQNIPAPPKGLQKLLSNYEPNQQEGILRIRHKILNFDRRMEEMPSVGSIKYGNGKSKTSKLCAELCTDNKGSLILFLWLPLKGLTSEKLARARIWTDWNDKALIEGYVVTGIGKTITTRRRVIATLSLKVKKVESFQILRLFNKNIWSNVVIPKDAREWAKQAKIVIDDVANDRSVTFEQIKLLEARPEIEFELSKCPYKNINRLIDIALEKWLTRI